MRLRGNGYPSKMIKCQQNLALANGKVLARVHNVEQKWLLYLCGGIVKTCHLKCSGYFLYARKQGADQIRSMRFT